MPVEPCDEVLHVTVEGGMVIVEGCGIAVTLTPAAAMNSGMEILERAVEAMDPAIPGDAQYRSGPSRAR